MQRPVGKAIGACDIEGLLSKIPKIFSPDQFEQYFSNWLRLPPQNTPMKAADSGSNDAHGCYRRGRGVWAAGCHMILTTYGTQGMRNPSQDARQATTIVIMF